MNKRLLKKVSDFESPVTVSRAVIAVDECLAPNLRNALEDRNFTVLSFKAGFSYKKIEELMAQRVLVTQNVEKFRELAAVHEFSIIDASNAPQEPKILAKTISELWNQLSLRHKQPFILRIPKRGTPTIEPVE